MKIESHCPICKKKNVTEKSHFSIGKKRFITLDCGHTYSIEQVQESTIDKITLADDRNLYPFQVEGVRFAEKSNFRCLISDEMGLGKTIQAVAAAKLHYDELKPILCIVKSSLTFQWMKEIVSGTGKPLVQILSTKDTPIPGFGIYITSFDSLPARKKKGSEYEYTDGLVPKLIKIGIKTLIIDECQMLKNHSASRTQAVRDIARATKKIDHAESLSTTRTDRIEKLKNLLRHYNLHERFLPIVARLKNHVLGVCECKVGKDGLIFGRILIDKNHLESATDEEIIETFKHEIAHAITPGAGHNQMWHDTAVSIGSTGNTYANCSGSVDIQDEEPTVKHIIALSGTPIKNNAIEYFPILNLLRPEVFPNRERFINNEVSYYASGNSWKPGGLKFPDHFHNKTKDFIIRRTREQVLPDLPKIQRDFKFYAMGKEVMDAYDKKVKVLSDMMDSEEFQSKKSFEAQSDILAQLQVLRHITGIAKIEPVVDYVDEYIEEANGEAKITIFHHHIDVGEILNMKLTELFPDQTIRMTAQDSSEEREKKIQLFKDNPNKKILIAPTLACGEGINLQFCNHAILMEREWNPANEEQAEGRFSRIGSVSSSILVSYPTATETIDEFFAELVERKREIVGQTLDGTADKWDQSSIIQELANIVVKKWRMK